MDKKFEEDRYLEKELRRRIDLAEMGKRRAADVEDTCIPPLFNSAEEFNELRRMFFFSEESEVKKASRDEIRGMDFLLKEIDEYLFYLKNYGKLLELGARTSPGLLLSGVPGMGKTLVARYIISQSEAKTIDADSFPRRTSTWTSDDIRALFSLAREYVEEEKKPVILFFDEFEVVAKERSGLQISESAVATALTTEIDGIKGKSTGVVIIATTNYERYIDGALLRPGRIGHHIEFGYPSRAGKEEILKYYCEKKPHESIDYDSFSYIFKEWTTPARIEELVEEAYLRSCMENLEHLGDARVTERWLLKLLMDSILGSPEDYRPDEYERFRMAVQVSGKVITAKLLKLPVQLAIVPKEGYRRGMTVSNCEKDCLRERLISIFGGKAACRLFGLPWVDEDPTHIAFLLAARNHMGINVMHYGDCCSHGASNFAPLSDKTRASLEQGAIKLVEESNNTAYEILNSYGKDGIERLAKALLEKEFLLQKEIDDLIGSVDIDAGIEIEAGKERGNKKRDPEICAGKEGCEEDGM
ncbi:MAG: AAA family ATPase [Candidatus Thermoplasmatota archaeon]|nr:AAA family ATPase [Candidatus Thermoplasmatota archaeon]